MIWYDKVSRSKVLLLEEGSLHSAFHLAEFVSLERSIIFIHWIICEIHI